MTNVTDIMLSEESKTLAATKNVTVEIHTDDSPTDPRTWGNIGKMYMFTQQQHDLGDVQLGNRADFLEEHKDIRKYFAEQLSVRKADIIIFDIEVTFYGHSSELSIYAKDHNPEGFCAGYIVTTKEEARDAYGSKYTKAVAEDTEEMLKGAVTTYQDYLNGNVFGYTIECNATGRTVDSQWGFYGNDDPYLQEEIQSNIDAWVIPTIYKFKFKPNLIKLVG